LRTPQGNSVNVSGIANPFLSALRNYKFRRAAVWDLQFRSQISQDLRSCCRACQGLRTPQGNSVNVSGIANPFLSALRNYKFRRAAVWDLQFRTQISHDFQTCWWVRPMLKAIQGNCVNVRGIANPFLSVPRNYKFRGAAVWNLQFRTLINQDL